MTEGRADEVILTLGLGLAQGQGLDDVTFGAGKVTARPPGSLSRALLAEVRPTIVMTPLFGRGYDAGLIAQMLSTFGFRGTLRVICPSLPNPAMVYRELCTMGPGLMVDLVLPDAPKGATGP